MTYIVKAQDATGRWINVVISAKSKKSASRLAEPTIQQEITNYRIIKRQISQVN